MSILKIGILGGGNMGKQIALLCASHEISVIVWNHKLRNDFATDLKKLALLQSKLGNLSKETIPAVLERIQYVDDMTELIHCNIIVEAVKEDYAIKSEVLKDFDAKVRGSRIVSSNTSTLSITGLASLTADPSCFIGIHFFNPSMSMKLVEVVAGEYTSKETVTSIIEFLTNLDKHPIVLPETPGFIVNRLLFPMINEAIFLLAEGIADAKTIDSCMKLGANHPMGPLELADFIGLDVCLSILETLVAETGDGKYRPAPLLRKFVRAEKFGRKSGVGFYSYRRGES
jgi:3-hydroxybutyryl-CoA dehydrogenase